MLQQGGNLPTTILFCIWFSDVFCQEGTLEGENMEIKGLGLSYLPAVLVDVTPAVVLQSPSGNWFQFSSLKTHLKVNS